MTRPLRTCGRFALAALLGVVAVLSAAPAPAARPSRQVLVIHSTYKGITAYEEFHDALVETLNADPSYRVEINTEYFDAIGPVSEDYERAIVEYLRRKYADTPVDVIVCVAAPATRLAIKLRPQTFPNAALVFGSIDHRMAAQLDTSDNTTGVTGVLDVRGTIELALRVQPDTEHVAIVVGSSENERPWWSRLAGEARAADASMEVIDLTGLAEDDLFDRLGSLPPRTIVLWGSLFRDANGTKYTPREALERARSVANAPIYGLYTHMLGDGIVGGSLVDLAGHGRATGEIVLRVLHGEPASSIPITLVENNRAVFDWRELRRWKIDESRLPPGSIVRLREPTAWDQYGWYIVGAVAVILAQSLLIAGLLVQRSRRLRAQLAAAERLEFERLISDLSNRISDVPPSEVDTVIADTIEAARDLFNADRLSLIQFVDAGGVGTVKHSATAVEITPLGEVFDFDAYPEILAELRRLEVVRIADLDAAAARMPATCAALERAGVKSLAAAPLHVGGTALGLLGVASLRTAVDWDDELISRLRILADIFANALRRSRDAEQMQKSEALSHAVLGSIAAQVCVVDPENRVVAGNDAWQRAAYSRDLDVACVLFGQGCASECQVAAICANAEAVRAREGIRSVISSGLPAFSMEYRTTTPAGEQWYLMTVERLRLPEGGAVVSNQNITPRKRAELEAEQRRQELTHFSRVSAMGELAASLAHELNQPLTGVLTNAQAAMRFLAADPPNVVEVREILDDIIEDDRRAGEVIRRLRSMLQSGSVEPSSIDVKDVVDSVVKLVSSDAILRDVTIETDVAASLPPVRGDRIQLQQVVLNLVVNAMDAMRGVPERCVTVRTMKSDPHTVCVSVCDTGPGIESEKLGRIFQPFFTTKAEGLGMGLSIARTIVEAHGGLLWATNNPDAGASFHFKIPIATAEDLESYAMSPTARK